MHRLAVGAAVTAAAAPFLVVIAVQGVTAGSSTASAQPDTCIAAQVQVGATENLTPDQLGNAAVIISKGQAMGVPQAGWVIALATSAVEAGLLNHANSNSPESMALPHQGEGSDHDSAGIMQQRPSAGWGTYAQIQNPDYAAGKFYEHLIAITGWETMDPGAAAQAVQGSAFPDRYAAKIPLATALVRNATGQPGTACTAQQDLTGGQVATHDAAGRPLTLTLPGGQAGATIRAALTQLGKPYSQTRSEFDYLTTTDPPYFDCSGLTLWAVWNGSGKTIQIASRSQTQYAMLPHVDWAARQPGMLIFYEGAEPDHVAIYVGQVAGVDYQVAATTYGQPLQVQPTYSPVVGLASIPYK